MEINVNVLNTVDPWTAIILNCRDLLRQRFFLDTDDVNLQIQHTLVSMFSHLDSFLYNILFSLLQLQEYSI